MQNKKRPRGTNPRDRLIAMPARMTTSSANSAPRSKTKRPQGKMRPWPASGVLVWNFSVCLSVAKRKDITRTHRRQRPSGSSTTPAHAGSSVVWKGGSVALGYDCFYQQQAHPNIQFEGREFDLGCHIASFWQNGAALVCSNSQCDLQWRATRSLPTLMTIA